MANTNIADWLASIPGLKTDFIHDWTETSNNDWRIDWDAIAGTPPVNTVLPAISGSLTVGATLTCTSGTWTGTATITYAYQWKRDGVDIGGATAATHVIVSDDVGTTLTCVVTATNANGVAHESATQAISAIAPVNTVLPVITDDGTPQEGETITVSTGTWTGQPTPTYTYQWKKGGVAINGATTNSYVIAPAVDTAGSVLTCTVTATNSAGTASATSASITVQ